MSEIDININRLTDIYRGIVSIPVQRNATLLKINDLWKLCVHYSSSDVDSGEKCSFKKYFEIECNESNLKIGTHSEMCDASHELSVAYSKKFRFKAIIKNSLKSKPFIEVWEENIKIKSLTSDILDKFHGLICTNNSFSSFEWSPNENSLLYIAEQKETQSTSFFKETDNTAKDAQKGTEFVYRDDWGEELNGFSHTCVCVVNIQQNFNIQVIEMKDFSLGEAFWINDHTIGFVAWKETPFRLGLCYCSDRKSILYSVDLLDPKLEPQLLYGYNVEECVRFPRMSPNGDFFVFLSNPLNFNCEASRLMKYAFKDKRSEVIIDESSDKNLFKPLYVPFGVATNCFVDNNSIVLDCIRNCQRILLRVDLITKKCQELKFPPSSASVLDVKDNILVILCSAPNAYPFVYIAKLESNATEPRYIKVVETREDKIAGISFKCDEIETNEDNSTLILHTILIATKNQTDSTGSLAPTVVYGHGGPHSSFTRGYFFITHFFAEIGFNTLLVNYRGSTGMDEEYIRSIRGSIGDGDIRDIITCIDYHHSKGNIDKNRLLLFGWSHSGFQALHLCGQYPNFGFKACAVANPVVDVSTIIDSTDTPDWAWVKCFGGERAFSFTNIANSEILQTMFNKSPINYVNNNCTPTLFLLGKYDRRCPMSQSLKYYKALKTRAIDVKCCVYEDSHVLQKVDVFADVMINIALWFLRYINIQ